VVWENTAGRGPKRQRYTASITFSEHLPLVARLPARCTLSHNELPIRSVGIALSPSFLAFGCPCLPARDVGEAGRDVLTRFSAFTLRKSGIIFVVYTSRFLCRQCNSRRFLGVNYPRARHRDGIHTPVEFALDSCNVAMSTHETSQTTV
jgi:hypothetical protein